VIGQAGRALAGAALLAAAPVTGQEAAQEGAVLLELSADGEVLARLPLGADGGFCLSWSHSVTGGAVADCFRLTSAGLVLERSFLHDFAAGLGHLPGRGTQRPAPGGGYWIEGIDEPLPGGALALRVGGPSVGHRIETSAGATLDLTALAAGRRVRLGVAAPGG
jgi:hypothetical protein